MTGHLMVARPVLIGGAVYYVPSCLTCGYEGVPMTTEESARAESCKVFDAMREGLKNKARRRELATA